MSEWSLFQAMDEEQELVFQDWHLDAQPTAAVAALKPVAPDFGQIDGQLLRIFRDRIDEIQRLKNKKKRERSRRRSTCSSQSQESSSSLESQRSVLSPPGSQAAAAAVANNIQQQGVETEFHFWCDNPTSWEDSVRRRTRSRPEGMLLYPLPNPGDEYILRVLDVLRVGQIVASTWQAGRWVNIDRALVHQSFAFSDFQQVHNLIRLMSSSSENHCTGGEKSYVPIEYEGELEDLWHNATYELHLKANSSPVQQTVQDLSAVQKYRLRKRSPCPTETNKGKRYKISNLAQQRLSEIYEHSMYPDKSQKFQLEKLFGLSKDQVSNWFKNRRQRYKHTKKPAVDKNNIFSTEAQDYHQYYQCQNYYSENLYYTVADPCYPQPINSHHQGNCQQANDKVWKPRGW